MEQLINDIFGSWAGIVCAIIALCAAIAVALPAPNDQSNSVYRVIYKALNWIAMNWGKATNADDAEQAQKKA